LQREQKERFHEDLRTKLAEIMEIRKEVEEKSKMIAEKVDQCNAMLIQFEETRFLKTSAGIFVGFFWNQKWW
jgi:hypothetical protein